MEDVNVSAAVTLNLTTTNTSCWPSTQCPTPLPEAVATTVLLLTSSGNALGLASIVMNVAFLFAVRFIKDRSTAYLRLIQNLAVADLLATCTFLLTQNWPHGPFAHIDPNSHFVLRHGLSYMFRGTPWMFFTVYLLMLTCLTLNQYVAVCKPWRYSELVTSRTVSACIVVTWCLSSLQLLVPFFILLALYYMHDKQHAMHMLYFVSHVEIHVWMGIFVLTIIFNIAIDLVVYRKIRQLKSKRQGSVRGGNSLDAQNIRKKHRAFVTLSLLLVASIFCRLPFPLIAIVGLNIDYSMGVSTSELINASVVFLLYINFLADPIIYVTRTHDVRNTYRTLFTVCARKCRCRGRQRQSSCENNTRSWRTEKTNSFVMETRECAKTSLCDNERNVENAGTQTTEIEWSTTPAANIGDTAIVENGSLLVH